MTADQRFVCRAPLGGTATGRQFTIDWGEQSHVNELRVWYRELDTSSLVELTDGRSDWTPPTDLGATFRAIRCLQFVWRAPDGHRHFSPAIGPIHFRFDGQPVPHDDAISLRKQDVINGLYGFRGEAGIHAVGLVTQDGPLPVLGTAVGLRFDWRLRHVRHEATNALVTGVYGFTDTDGFCGIGLRYGLDGLGPARIRTGPSGRIVPVVDAGRIPEVDAERVPQAPAETDASAGASTHTGAPTPETARPNPNYRRVDVRRVDQWDNVLYVHALDGPPAELVYAGRSRDPDTQEPMDSYVDLEGETLTVDLGPSRRITLTDGTAFTVPLAPAPAAPDGPRWDNVFGLENRVHYLAWAMRGLDISRLAPFNFQEASGVLQQEVFKAPAPGSLDFHIATDGKATVVPNGWQFVGNISGSTKGRTTSSSSEEEARLTWATSLGISAEADAVGAKVAYKNNSKAHAELSSSSAGKDVSTTNETMQLSHSIVVDLATVELADGFRVAVEELAERPTTDGIREFLARFGTHFAYAITYGEKSWEQRHETEASVADSMTHGSSQDQSLEVGYHGAVGGASASVAVGAESESNLSTKRGTGSDVSSSGSVGSPTEPVPILLEVEELTHLLSPVFFDDPFVYDDLESAIVQYFFEGRFELEHDYDETRHELAFEIAPGSPLNFRTPTDNKRVQVHETGPAGKVTENWFFGGQRYVIPAGFAYLADVPVASLNAATFPLSPVPPTSEGKTIRATGADERVWWIRGGKRHIVLTRHPDPEDRDAANRFFFLPGAGSPVAPGSAIFADFVESGEQVTIVGKMLRAERSAQVWWVDSDQLLHPIPSSVVVEVLGGWELVALVSENRLALLPKSPTPTSVDGKMIKLAGPEPDVWVIHRRRRHRIRNDLGVTKRGGWQNVAIVRREVLDWFPDSGVDAL